MPDEPTTMAEAAAPEQDVPRPAPPYKLYSTTAVVVATLLGSLIAGGIVLAIDLARIGRKGEAWQWIAMTAGGTMLLLWMGYRLPENAAVGATLIGILVPGTMYAVARSTLTRPLAEHAAAGGRQASTWGAAGIGVLCSAALLLILLAYEWQHPPFPGERIDVQGNEVYYSGGATAAEARQVGDYLVRREYMGVDDGVSAHLEKTSEGYALDLLLWKHECDDPEILAWIHDVGLRLVDLGFGPRLDLRLLNEDMAFEKTVVAP